MRTLRDDGDVTDGSVNRFTHGKSHFSKKKKKVWLTMLSLANNAKMSCLVERFSSCSTKEMSDALW